MSGAGAPAPVGAITAAQVLDVWERGATVEPLVRPLLVLAAAQPGERVEDVAAVPLGQRDAHLNAVREALVGSAMEATAACPSCCEPVEARFDGRDVWSSTVDVPAEVTVQAGGFEVTCRPLSTADLLASAGAASPEEALLAQCVVSARRLADGERVAAADLPVDVRDTVETALGDADPNADIVLSLTCPVCATSWPAPLDFGAFVWEEVDHAARRMLAEVDLLARAYGWREPDVLALSAWRRRCYLELAQG